MTKTMLIDAANQEEVRVCVLENGKVEDFDFEYSSRKPLRGNIYLARVTRVEPSLQAAFVEYGGNRHGFLAFSEIHPDYYQVPISDRRAIQEAEAEEASLAAALNLSQRGDDDDGGIEDIEMDDDDAHYDDRAPSKQRENFSTSAATDDEADDVAEFPDDDTDDVDDEDEEEESSEELSEDDDNEPNAEHSDDDDEVDATASNAQLKRDDENETSAEVPEDANDNETPTNDVQFAEAETESSENDRDSESGNDADLESNSSSDSVSKAKKSNGQSSRAELLERYKEARRKKARLLRNYKIQEVIKRRQILLVQVVKEERGNKGAALTTYMSLAGRYCVLMPNTARGGGISRKIPVAADRKRLRRVVDGLDVPEGMGLIIRTAGAKRTKAEIKRDYEYLVRLWENIRTLTLNSIAPSLIYEEANLIKRAIRDLYDKDIDMIHVEGDAGYREAKDFMKMLMPSHAKNVQPYKEQTPLFLKHNVESQLDAMYQPTVRLKSGGYIVINQTEALIAIDVNSGKSTRERNIEQTALRTNLEAADEAARQCRMRDLAGLIVIDFIDMDEQRNNRSVERRLKDALKMDRARIQLGRISNFGLLEMSRQRRRSGIVDGTTHTCPTCGGAGAVRSQEMAALRILRAAENEAISGKAGHLHIRAALDVALYVLNHKRDWLTRITTDYGVTVEITADNTKAGDQYEIEKTGVRIEPAVQPAAVRADTSEPVEQLNEDESEQPAAARSSDDAEGGETGKKRRRRRRRRKDTGSSAPTDESEAQPSAVAASSDETDEDDEANASAQPDEESDRPKKRRRRGRRGGRKAMNKDQDSSTPEAADTSDEAPQTEAVATAVDPTVADQPFIDLNDADDDARPSDNLTSPTSQEDQPAVNSESPDASENTGVTSKKPANVETAAEATHEPKGPPRKGWWQRAIGG